MLDFSFTVLKMMGRFDSAAIHSNSEFGIPATDPEFKAAAAKPRLLIVGASTRAAAWSAIRAGCSPVCGDLYADEDLLQVAEVVAIVSYPDSLSRDLKDCTSHAWMFTGAMENHLAALTPLIRSDRIGRYCGPSLSAMANLRNPAWLADRLRPLGCYPEVVAQRDAIRFSTGNSALGATWLKKPLASGGGREIQRIQAGDDSASTTEPCYWQEYVVGMPMSATFAVNDLGCQCLMVSEQIVGCTQVSAPTEYTYCGSIGPLPISTDQSTRLTGIAETLVKGLGYRGLLGLDLIWDGRQFWLIEVNPRYTASCELWDLWSGRSAVGEHLRACGIMDPEVGGPRRVDPPYEDGRIFGKLVLYADVELIAPDLSCCLASRSVWSVPWMADIPTAGSRIPVQSPICTVFASAETRHECERKLKRRAKRVRAWFDEPTSPRRKPGR